jgi:CheY-like chemotaxis protein
LHRLIKNLVQQFETQAVKKGIYFRYILGAGVPEHIICDGVRLSQILLNLLGNAFKFTFKGDVYLSVNRSDTELLIAIKDSGVGIPGDKIATLFEPFSQLHDKRAGRQQGVGLGLSITKKLLELMHGRIDCDSRVNEGTEFNLAIPIEVVKKSHNKISEKSIKNLKTGFKILVAEDNQANQFIIKAILEKRNHKVTLVENGEQAVELATTELFDLVLMDMVMPIMDGVTAAEVINDELGEHAPPIIALTANAGLSDKEKCLNAGMKEVLTKPLNSALLDEKIASIINSKVRC